MSTNSPPHPSSDTLVARPEPGLDEFHDLLFRAWEGDQDAWGQLHERFQGNVRRVIRRLMDQRLRKASDSMDLAQEVWLSVLGGAVAGKDFPTSSHFVRWLEAVAQNKTLELARHSIATQKRSLAREEALGDCDDSVLGHTGRDDDPAEQAAEEDDWAHILAGLPERDREAVKGLRAGESLPDLARRLNRSVKSLYRLARRIQQQRGSR